MSMFCPSGKAIQVTICHPSYFFRLPYLFTIDLHYAIYLVSEMAATSTTEIVQFTVKGQVVIPAKFRREFQIEDGTKAAVTTTPEGILLRPITTAYIKSLRGKAKGSGIFNILAVERRSEKGQSNG